MGAVVFGSVVSFAIATFAIMVVLREFQGRWTQLLAALAFDERAFVTPAFGEIRRSAAPRQAQLAPAAARRLPTRRAAA
jgi:hypothetical protein